MRLGGGVAAIAAPVILTILSERKEGRALPGRNAAAARRETDEPRHAAA
jgi:hypothetical protein